MCVGTSLAVVFTRPEKNTTGTIFRAIRSPARALGGGGGVARPSVRYVPIIIVDYRYLSV